MIGVLLFLFILGIGAAAAQQCTAGDADTIPNASGGPAGMALGWSPRQVRTALRDVLRRLHYDLLGGGSDSAGFLTEPSYRFPEEPGVEAFRRYKHPGTIVRAYVRSEADSSRLFVLARAVCRVAEPPPAGYPVPVESSLELFAAQEIAFDVFQELRSRHPRRLLVPRGPPPAQVLGDARSQILARNLDSASTLLRAVTTSSLADSSELAEGFMWLGVVSFYKGTDSATSAAFRDALRNEPLLIMGPRLARLDSSLATIWEKEQTVTLCGESLPAWGSPAGSAVSAPAINADARAALRPPEILSGPPVQYPDYLRSAYVQGRVIVRAIIDTNGHAENGSARVLRTPHAGFNAVVVEYMEKAQFRAATSSAGPVRSCVIVPVDFTIKR